MGGKMPTEYYRAYRAANPGQQRAADLKCKYGITLAEHDAMLVRQDYACDICDEPFPEDFTPRVDHNHTSGAVRGLLCVGCNLGLGAFKDDPVRLEKAISYLRRTGTST